MVPLIYCDDREKSAVRKYLDKTDADIQTVHLINGDYQISNDAAFEHKTISDFLSSEIGSEKLKVNRQVRAMHEVFPKSALLISGTLAELLSARRINPNSIFGMLQSILWSGCAIKFLTNEEITANYIYETAKKEQGESNHKPFSVHGKTSHLSDSGKIEYIAQSIDGVGAIQARNLLLNLKSIQAIANASYDDLIQIKGIGKETAKAILRNLQGEYK